MKSHKLIPITLLALALYATGACADATDDSSSPETTGNPEASSSIGNSDPSIFSISGFGTLGVVHSSEDDADFTSSPFKPNGAGHNRNRSADVDSLIGVQLTANLTPKLSAVLQSIAEQNYDNSYWPHVEWANVKYQFTPDFDVRVGRTVLPIFLVADYRKVSYTYPWVRPPLEIYNLVPITNNDGVDASYRMHFGEITNTIQATYGSIERKIVDGSKVHGRNQWAISNTTENGSLAIHANYTQANLTLEGTHPLFEAYRQFGPEGVAIADKYDCDGDIVRVGSLGASYDPGDWFLMGELARRTSNCLVGDNTAWYVSGGYRFGKLTPYITYAQARADNLSDPGLNVSALPPFLAGTATGLNAGLDSALSRKPDQNTISVGGRWDFMKNTALKLQFDHIRINDGSSGVLINPQPGFQSGVVNVFSATIDFVF